MRRLLAVALLLTLAAHAYAQGFWAGKPYSNWSKNEVERLLRDSPWAKRYVMSRTAITLMGSEGADEINMRAGGGTPEIFYQVQLRSAQPIREALVRRSQLAGSYAKMSEQERADFERSAQAFLSAQFPDTIVVYVEYGSNVNDADRELAHYWQNLTGDLIRGAIYLTTPTAGRLTMLDYTPLKGNARAFQLTFPRVVDGKPVVGPNDKSLLVEFPHPHTSIEQAKTVVVSFDPRRMRATKDKNIVY